jgi:hypothetical protein
MYVGLSKYILYIFTQSNIFNTNKKEQVPPRHSALASLSSY